MHIRIPGGTWIVAIILGTTCVVADQPTRHERAPPEISGFYLPNTLALTAFQLVDHHSRAFTNAALHGHWTLLSFGYTHCPDVCPMTLSGLRAIKKQLAASHSPMTLKIVFVSLDPQRDTAALLGQYLGQFDDDFVGVGGAPAAVDAFAEQLRVKYAVSGSTSDTYVLDHTSSVALFNPRGELRALFSTPLRADAVSADLRRIYQAESPR